MNPDLESISQRRKGLVGRPAYLTDEERLAWDDIPALLDVLAVRDREIETLGEGIRSWHDVANDYAARNRQYQRVLAVRDQQLEDARIVLATLEKAFSSMPDAGFTDQDPRWKWWYQTEPARRVAREWLARNPLRERVKP